MRPVAQLVCRAAFGELDEFAALDEPQWAPLALAAAVEDVEGLLYRNCRTATIVMPAATAAAWGQAYRLGAARVFHVLAELHRLLTGLDQAGLEVLVLPGAALLPLYPDPGCRPMDDVDLLARPGTLAAVAAAVARLGFAPVPRHPTLLSGNGLLIDLHEDPLNSNRIGGRRLGGHLDPADVWRTRSWRRLEGFPVPVMSANDEILYTAAHALRHSYRRLTWFIDLEAQLRLVMDWGSIQERARACRLERPLLHGMRLLQGDLGRPLPPRAAAWLAASPPPRWEAVVASWAFRDRPAGTWGDLLWAGGVSGWGARFRFLVETCFPRADVLLQVFPRVPSLLAPLAYVLRLGQLVGRAGTHLLRLIRR